MVRWMQYSDETGEKIPTETLRWLLRCGLGPENIRYHAGKYLSTTQLMNYIRRQQLRKRGFRVIKAKNDVEDGIRLVSTKLNLIKIIFSNVCQNTIKEFASYIWDAKAAERGEDKPIKQYDHAMDAVRYFVYTIFGDKPRLNRNLKGGL